MFLILSLSNTVIEDPSNNYTVLPKKIATTSTSHWKSTKIAQSHF